MQDLNSSRVAATELLRAYQLDPRGSIPTSHAQECSPLFLSHLNVLKFDWLLPEESHLFYFYLTKGGHFDSVCTIMQWKNINLLFVHRAEWFCCCKHFFHIIPLQEIYTGTWSFISFSLSTQFINFLNRNKSCFFFVLAAPLKTVGFAAKHFLVLYA